MPEIDIYAWVSTTDQDPQRQLDKLREFAENTYDQPVVHSYARAGATAGEPLTKHPTRVIVTVSSPNDVIYEDLDSRIDARVDNRTDRDVETEVRFIGVETSD